MKKFLFILLVGFILGVVFIYSGGDEYIRSLSGRAERASSSIEKYTEKMSGFKKRAESVKKKAEEAGKRIEKYIP
ncbi:MAG: hypothetical protein BMS9Abin23_0151 [Thermodesulfobacteriota bacterium]|nr:MAG: hypothetical protein BMS9Abin23_0151 [Thermodesulfobacteriota bacterium]